MTCVIAQIQSQIQDIIEVGLDLTIPRARCLKDLPTLEKCFDDSNDKDGIGEPWCNMEER